MYLQASRSMQDPWHPSADPWHPAAKPYWHTVTRGPSHAEESEDGDKNESDNCSDSEDDDYAPMIEQLGSSVESLIGKFEEMYDWEVELDYEN
jgi:hypothetical protein